MKHYTIKVKGKVQGVFYRSATKAVADQLGVKGYVKNLEDGSVLVEAEGDDFALESFIEWCNEGPEKAVVESVNVLEAEVKNYTNFEVVKKNFLW